MRFLCLGLDQLRPYDITHTVCNEYYRSHKALLRLACHIRYPHSINQRHNRTKETNDQVADG